LPASSAPTIQPLLAIFVGLALIGSLAAGYVFWHRSPPGKTAIAVAAPSPSLAPAPSASLSLASATPEITPLPTIAPAETAPLRLRPGELLRGHATREPSVAPATETAPPARLRPGQPIASAGETTAGSPPIENANRLPAASQPFIREVVASSELRDENRTHRPTFAFDGNAATAWMPQEGAKNPSITAHFKTATVVTSVSLLGGNSSNEQEFRAHDRVKQLRVTLSDGANQLFHLSDETPLQTFKIDHPATVEWVKFEIVSVYRGLKTRQTPIAEISFNREPVSERVPASVEHPKSGSHRRRSQPPRSGQ